MHAIFLEDFLMVDSVNYDNFSVTKQLSSCSDDVNDARQETFCRTFFWCAWRFEKVISTGKSHAVFHKLNCFKSKSVSKQKCFISNSVSKQKCFISKKCFISSRSKIRGVSRTATIMVIRKFWYRHLGIDIGIQI